MPESWMSAGEVTPARVVQDALAPGLIENSSGEYGPSHRTG